MRHDSRLSRLLHVLLHMADADGPITSETIARMLDTNPALVRRTMAGLREAGYVASEKGHGGGWTLNRPLAEITLLDVYRTIGEPRLLAFGLANADPQCLVEQAVNASVQAAIAEAEEKLRAQFAATTLADIAGDFERRMAERGLTTAMFHRH